MAVYDTIANYPCHGEYCIHSLNLFRLCFLNDSAFWVLSSTCIHVFDLTFRAKFGWLVAEFLLMWPDVSGHYNLCTDNNN